MLKVKVELLLSPHDDLKRIHDGLNERPPSHPVVDFFHRPIQLDGRDPGYVFHPAPLLELFRRHPPCTMGWRSTPSGSRDSAELPGLGFDWAGGVVGLGRWSLPKPALGSTAQRSVAIEQCIHDGQHSVDWHGTAMASGRLARGIMNVLTAKRQAKWVSSSDGAGPEQILIVSITVGQQCFGSFRFAWAGCSNASGRVHLAFFAWPRCCAGGRGVDRFWTGEAAPCWWCPVFCNDRPTRGLAESCPVFPPDEQTRARPSRWAAQGPFGRASGESSSGHGEEGPWTPSSQKGSATPPVSTGRLSSGQPTTRQPEDKTQMSRRRHAYPDRDDSNPEEIGRQDAVHRCWTSETRQRCGTSGRKALDPIVSQIRRLRGVCWASFSGTRPLGHAIGWHRLDRQSKGHMAMPRRDQRP